MKIALLRQRVAALGGAETTLKYLVRGLAAAGHEVTVYGTAPDEAKAALGPAVAYVRVPVWGGKTLRLLTYALNYPPPPAGRRPPGGVQPGAHPVPPGLPGRGRLPPGVAVPPGALSLPPGPGRPEAQARFTG